MNTPAYSPDTIPQSALALVDSLRLAGERVVEGRMQTEAWEKLNAADAAVAELPPVDLPLRHIFTPGLYTREIFMPKGAVVMSRVHLFEHPFVISRGVVSVWDDENGWVTLRAPHTGVTKPGTRRALYIHEDTTWTTFHVTNETDPEKIVEMVTYDHRKLSAPSIAGRETKEIAPT